jgi:hypothetical protein
VRKLAVLGVLCLTLLLVGCKKSPVKEGTKASSELAEAQKDTAEKLDDIRGQIATLRNAAAAQRARPDFMEDLVVAVRLAGRVSTQAGKAQTEEAERSVARLVRALAALVASAPASRIQQHLERAEVRLTAGDMAGATDDVLAAAGEAFDPTAPALVPDVLEKLEEAAGALAEGNANEAADLLAEVMAKVETDPTAEDLATAHLTAIEAANSLDRKAWPVLMAQATQISNLLRAVEKRATPEPRAEAEAAEAEVPQTEEKSAPAPAGPPSETRTPEPAPETPSEGAASAAGSAKEAPSEPGDATPKTPS